MNELIPIENARPRACRRWRGGWQGDEAEAALIPIFRRCRRYRALRFRFDRLQRATHCHLSAHARHGQTSAFQRHPDESVRMMKIPYVAMRIIAWVGVIGLAVASWTPGQEMIRTGFNTRLERTTAYLMAGIAVLAAYPQKPLWLIAVLLGGYAGVLELGQMYVPGRHAALLDWLASSGGVVCACVMVFFCRSRTRSLK